MDPRGRVWFTELLGNKIGVYDSYLNSLKEYPVPTNTSGPADLTFDTKGNLWFTEAYASQLGEFNLSAQSFVEYPLGGNASSEMISSPVGIAIDAQGIVWVADHGGNWIVRFDPQTKVTTKFPTHFPPSDVYPISLVNDLLLDKQGRVWFAEHGGNSIGYYVPETRSMVEFPIPTGPISTALWLALAPSGDVWFAEWSGNNIGTVNSNAITLITVTTPTNSIVVNQGDQFSIPLQVGGSQRFAENGTMFSAWSSYTPTDASAKFTPSNLTLSATQVSVEAQFTISKNTDPGNYTLALGVQAKSVRVLTMVSVEVLKYNPPSLPISLTSEIVLLVVAVAAAVALVLRRSSKRSRQE
jgi:streptogramin lyase